MKPFFGLIILMLFVQVLFWPGGGRSWVELEVKEGVTGHQLAQQLLDERLIRSKVPFLFWLRLRLAETKIKVGRYRFSAGRSAYWLVDDLLHGRSQKVRVVIPEGFSGWQIAERLEAQKVCDADEFNRILTERQLEGFLCPATYDINLGIPASLVAQILKDRFDQNWTEEMEKRAQDTQLTKKEVVTLASIIQREARMRDELPLIAGVYRNRLKKGMRLEADPTVQYGMGYWVKRLTNKDYRNTISPYNTYLYAGLPPGPICSPGLDALKAALWPAQTEALYFLATPDGYHTFSTTYREHVNKINKRNKARRTTS